MYAIIADSGKQFKVEEGLELEVDLRDANEGDEITFDQVLAVSNGENFQLGQPTKGDKIYIQKFRRRKNSRRRTGHRQQYTKVVINKINS